MFKRTTPLILLVAGLGMTISLPAMAEDNGNQRRGWFKEFDYNGDKELKGKEIKEFKKAHEPAYTRLQQWCDCLLYTSPSPRDRTRSRMPSSA